MTPNSISAQVADLSAAASQFTGDGDTLNQAVAQWSNALNKLGEFWGTEANGPEFGATYQPLAAQVLAAANLTVQVLRGIGDGLRQMGQRYNITENQIQAALDDIRANLSNGKLHG